MPHTPHVKDARAHILRPAASPRAPITKRNESDNMGQGPNESRIGRELQ
jgi:hypothetical protein